MASKKVSRQRGQRTHGYGSEKKHRGKGSRGGRGMAGSEGHRMTYILKYERSRIGKTGFVSKTGRKLRCINLRDLARIAGKEKKVDLSALGYDKLLGTGEIKAKLEVKADYCSAKAKEKIEKAGGKIVSDNVVEEAAEDVTEEAEPAEDLEEAPEKA